jgi:hypothetical protein
MAIHYGVEKEFLSVVEAETLSGMSRWSWRSWAYKGTISSTKVGKRLLIPLTEVRRVLAEGTRPRLQDGQV